MATEDRTEAGAPGFDVNVDQERHWLAVTAAQQIASIAGPLQSLTAHHADPMTDAAHQLAIRTEQLAGVILSALDDGMADLEAERRHLLGPEMYRRAHSVAPELSSEQTPRRHFTRRPHA